VEILSLRCAEQIADLFVGSVIITLRTQLVESK